MHEGGSCAINCNWLSGHAEENSLAIYPDLALADVSDEYEQAMRNVSGRVMLSGSYRSFPLCSPILEQQRSKDIIPLKYVHNNFCRRPGGMRVSDFY
jgi:hypothetical protein